MRKKKVWRYYCEFCKKSGCSAGHMKNHEKHCTMNPKRDCRMCNISGTGGESIDILVITFIYNGLAALREAAEGCPACMLAAMRQAEVKDTEVELLSEIAGWSYEEEKKEWWDEINAEQNSRIDQGGIY
jgi:hypothetical protein